MKKAQREKLAATLLQRHVRGWRVRSKFPLAKWRRERALRKAARDGDLAQVCRLLDFQEPDEECWSGFDIDAWDMYGRTALHWAARGVNPGHTDCVKALLERKVRGGRTEGMHSQ